MKKIQQFVILLMVAAFGNLEVAGQEAEVGTEYVLVIENESRPKHIKFPSKREILKRGAVPNYQSLNGVIVVVEKVESKNNMPQIFIKRKDGKPFFRFFNSIKANVSEAMESGELARI